MKDNRRRVPDLHESRTRLVAALVVSTLLAVLARPPTTNAQTADPLTQQIEFNIPQGTSLESALIMVARATGMQIMMSATAVAHRTAPAMHGKFRASDLLSTLLHGSGLTYTVDGATLHVLPNTPTSIANPVTSQPRASQPSDTEADPPKDSAPTPNGDSALPIARSASPDEQRPARLRTVLVTAEKRSESMQNVPISMSALTSAQLSAAADYQFQDYVGKVPGLTLIASSALGNQLVIRGLSSGSNAVNSPVAAYIDDTPYTAAGPWAGSFLIAPDLDTFDMQRIEVLRGPQGTLYGAQALGGLIKYVTNPPNPNHFAATVEAGGTSVYNSRSGYDVHAMINIPILSNAALRLVGYDRYYPGFIDDPSRNLTGINGTHFEGGRASLLFDPLASLSIRLTALYQRRSWADNGNEDVDPTSLTPSYGPLIQERVVGQPGYNTDNLYNMTVALDLGFAKLLSSTSDSQFQDNGITDYTVNYSAYASFLLHGPYGVVDNFQPHDRAFTQEIRLSSSTALKLDWQLGLFYTDQRGADVEDFWPVDLTRKQIVYNLPLIFGTGLVPVRYKEPAGYADFDYHILPNFDFGAGARYSTNTQKFNEVLNGIFFGGPSNILTTSTDHDLTYSADLRWHPLRGHMVYARVATGYQPGGPNDVLPSVDPSAARSYSSSTATSYELGVKDELLDGRLNTAIDVFDVDWRKIQVEAIIGGFNTFTNGGTARSFGSEWELDYLPIPELTLSTTGAYTHAYLTQPTPATVNGHTGDRLPGAPLISGSASMRYSHPVARELMAVGELSWRYTGSSYADFTAAGSRQQMPSFGILDLTLGVNAMRWSCNFFIKNATNKLAINWVSLRPAPAPASAAVYLPRTLGFDVTYDF